MSDDEGFNGPRSAGEDGFGRLLNKLQQMDRRLAAVERGAPLKAAGIGVNEDGMVVNSSLEVAGDLEATGDLDVTGNAQFSGNTHIGGVLSFNPNAIGNEYLANPLKVVYDAVNDFDITIGATETDTATATLVVPAGFTEAVVVATSQVALVNPQAVDQSVASRVYIDWTPTDSAYSGRAYTKALASSDIALFPTAQSSRTVTGGQAVTIRVVLIEGPGTTWGATPGFVSLNAYMILTR